jgi:hypothetical protein
VWIEYPQDLLRRTCTSHDRTPRGFYGKIFPEGPAQERISLGYPQDLRNRSCARSCKDLLERIPPDRHKIFSETCTRSCMHGPLIVTILQVEKSKKSYELEKWQIERIFPVLQVEILYDKNSRLRIYIYIYTHTRFSHFSMPKKIKKKQQIEIPAKMVKNITKLYMYIYTQSWRFHKGKIASLKTGHFACIYIYVYTRNLIFAHR